MRDLHDAADQDDIKELGIDGFNRGFVIYLNCPKSPRLGNSSEPNSRD